MLGFFMPGRSLKIPEEDRFEYCSARAVQYCTVPLWQKSGKKIWFMFLDVVYLCK